MGMWKPFQTSSGGSGAVTSKWAGKKANFLGDSITRGTGTSNVLTKPYHALLAQRIPLAVARNYGKDGSSIVGYGGSFHDRMTAMDTDSNLNFVFGGTNDFFFNQPMGSLYTINGTTGAREATSNTLTFYGALHTICKYLIANYPNAQNVLMTPLHKARLNGSNTELEPNTQGLFLEDYVDAIIKIGKFYGIPVLDLFSTSGIQPNEPANYNLYFNTAGPGDGIHPNDVGHSLIADKIQAFLETI